jgi:type III restriction enzyme
MKTKLFATISSPFFRVSTATMSLVMSWANLVVLTLMLPSASRQNKETLKVFKDSGGFGAFFPKDDDVQGHAKLLERFPNLDAFGDGKGLFQRQVKTSLGNTLRILSPVVILDEGHKAFSEMAQDTLRGLNPSIIVELSATPTDASNVLVDIKGLELKREDMIKLDLHINNKESTRWKSARRACGVDGSASATGLADGGGMGLNFRHERPGFHGTRTPS